MYAKKIIFSGLSAPALGKFSPKKIAIGSLWYSPSFFVLTTNCNQRKFFGLVFMHQAAEYQNRRGTEKQVEAERRKALLSQEATDITPANKSQHVWSAAGSSIDKFENEWSMKPVSVRGIFDHEQEIQVTKERNGEKGVEIITPFYTHLDAQGRENAIIVNRGWVPWDLKD